MYHTLFWSLNRKVQKIRNCEVWNLFQNSLFSSMIHSKDFKTFNKIVIIPKESAG